MPQAKPSVLDANAFLRDLGSSPDVYPFQFGNLFEKLLMVEMNEAIFRAASFLDNRFPLDSMPTLWVPQAVLAERLSRSSDLRPLHFIFHIGHAGSTLLSRLLAETGQVLSLREPLTLAMLANGLDVLGRPESALSENQFAANLELLLRLWSRGYTATRAVVVKATSSAARLAPRLMAVRPAAHAIYLVLPAEVYLAQLLAARTSDLKLFAPERIRRLEALLSEPPPPLYSLALGEIAAMSWLTERLTERGVLAALGPRVLSLDFEDFLSRQEESLARILAHLRLEADGTSVAALLQSPSVRHYSKDRKQSYSPEKRTAILAQSRSTNAAEIRRGLAWLQRLGARHANIAALLS
jgi:hypothetical protein